MKKLYNYLYEGILSGSDSIVGGIEGYADAVSWVKNHVRCCGHELEDNEFEITYDASNNRCLKLVDSDFTSRLSIVFDKDSEVISDLKVMKPASTRVIFFENDPKIKAIENIINLLTEYSWTTLIFEKCSIKYINDIYTKLKLRPPFNLDMSTVGQVDILNCSDKSFNLKDIIPFKTGGVDELDCPDSIISYDVDKNGFNDFRTIKCKELQLNLTDLGGLRLQISQSEIDKLVLSGNLDEFTNLTVYKSKIGNLLELINEWGDKISFDSNSRTLSKIKPSDLKQFDILGQELSKGDYIISPAFDSHGSWGNSGLRILCSNISSLTGITVNNGYKNLSHKLVLKVPEIEDLRVNLQKENESINHETLSVGDIVAYCDANKGYNTGAHIEIGKIEKIGKTITVNHRRTYPNYVYKIDKAWLKKMDVNKKYKDLY